MYRKDTIKPYVIQCMAMNLSEVESLKYLNDRGFKISRQYYFKLRKQIKESRFDRNTKLSGTELNPVQQNIIQSTHRLLTEV